MIRKESIVKYLSFLNKLDNQSLQEVITKSIKIKRLVMVTAHGEYSIRDRYEVRVVLLKDMSYLNFRLEQEFRTIVYLDENDKFVKCETSYKSDHYRDNHFKEMKNLIEEYIASKFE